VVFLKEEGIMKIEISDKAKAFINKKKSSSVTVGLVIAGCCVEIGEPNVTVGEPQKDKDKYNYFEVEDFNVYFFKNPSLKDNKVIIDTQKFLGMESLTVKGLKYF